MTIALPEFILVDELAKHLGVSLHQGYEVAKQMPAGVVVKFGRKIRINVDAYKEWLANGGDLAKRNSPKVSSIVAHPEDDEQPASVFLQGRVELSADAQTDREAVLILRQAVSDLNAAASRLGVRFEHEFESELDDLEVDFDKLSGWQS